MVYIYALRQGKKIVYVGQSKDLKRRMYEHAREKEFDNYVVLDDAESKKESLLIENYYIMKHDPKYNKVLNSLGSYGNLTEISNYYKIKRKHLKNWVEYYKFKPSFSNKYIEKEINLAITNACHFESPQQMLEENRKMTQEHLKNWLGEELYETYVVKGEIFDGKVR